MNDSIRYCSNPVCSKEIKGFGNNPQPFLNLKIEETVCNSCNEIFVIPERMGEPMSKFAMLLLNGFKKQ